MNYIYHCISRLSIEGLSWCMSCILLNELIIPSKAQEEAKCLR